ncbi:hypothetical protein [Aliikangiella sp. IMCC44632]
MNFQKMSESEIWAIANPIMDNLMQASTDIDHQRHVQDFTDRAKAIVTPERKKRDTHNFFKKHLKINLTAARVFISLV